ncbi:hypothetical protein [Paracoccus methylarcula]|uniref:hypothetical protein n=1 Tax=Paracoccus methylarcula TaxID=72022 RepID=UPI0011CDD32F|nr:hypothetical protein [Paracoccus methylarcula]
MAVIVFCVCINRIGRLHHFPNNDHTPAQSFHAFVTCRQYPGFRGVALFRRFAEPLTRAIFWARVFFAYGSSTALNGCKQTNQFHMTTSHRVHSA